eukprot:scaffold157571_cov35-Tisochrysis_lutea.AAC.3
MQLHHSARPRLSLAESAHLVELNTGRVGHLSRQRRGEHVIQICLLICICKVWRSRPCGIRKIAHTLGLVGESLNPPVELTEHPGRTICRAHVLNIEHASVGERAVHLEDELVARERSLEDGVSASREQRRRADTDDAEVSYCAV